MARWDAAAQKRARTQRVARRKARSAARREAGRGRGRGRGSSVRIGAFGHSLGMRFAAVWAVIVVGACASSGLSVFFYNLLNSEHPVSPIVMIGTLAFMGVVAGLLLRFVMRRAINQVKDLLSALDALADGDFSVRLDTEHARMIRPLFENVNAVAADLGNVQTLRENFVADFSHEFKTPINAINGFANLLLADDVDPADRDRYLRIIAQESDRLAHLTANTLLLNRLDSQQVLERERFSLDEQLREAVLLLEARWSAKKIELDIDLACIDVCGDRRLLMEVWVNLLGNAFKFTEPGGRVWVWLRRACQDGGSSAAACVEIGDTGVGMAPEQCARIFDRYYQADESHGTGGNGLGLAITRRIVVLSGGSIAVRSAPGEGSVFTVTLPL